MPFCRETRNLSSPNLVLNILHLVLGGLSLLLLTTSYIHYWALDIFLVTVAICLVVSAANTICSSCILSQQSRPKQFVGSAFHIIAGTFLIITGIDLIGWSDYDEKCGFKCPGIYWIGVAKILTFINGTLYGIHGFLEARGDNFYDEDFLGESLPIVYNPSPSSMQPQPVPSPLIVPQGEYQTQDLNYQPPSSYDKPSYSGYQNSIN